MNNLYNEQKNVSMRKLSMDEMAEINGGMTNKQWACSIGTNIASLCIAGAIGLATCGAAGFFVEFGLNVLSDWMCSYA
ncbi:MAG: hypothetical protein J6T30_02905 [Bacteroidales bacterium]|nr:hypothetical protein [Bacteroidales bacterium]